MFVIYLSPLSTHFSPHVWKDGGKFLTKESAEFQAKQIRKMRDRYKQVAVIPASVMPV